VNGSASPSDTLPVPPFGLSDALGRHVFLRPAEQDTDALVAFYERFDPADRAQGLPPTGADRIRRWLAVLADGPGVVAWYEDDAVGHAALVPDRAGGYELVVFVLQGFRGTGIGTSLVRALLGLGRTRGATRVWLTVQRWNHAAISVYRKTGFEREGEEGLEIIMSRPL
jgi:GNAT superfamily N-acetyltransferase